MTAIKLPNNIEPIQPLYFHREAVDLDYMSCVAHTKRFLERWTADKTFREQFSIDPYGVTRKYGLKADPEAIRLLWDDEAANQQDATTPTPLPVRRYRAFIQEKFRHRENLHLRECQPSNPNFKVWRQRQIARTYSQLGPLRGQNIVHAPVCFELSKGCSVGCWFCGVAAPPLESNFSYESKASLWQEVLEVTREIIGKAAGKGFCYWASDPLDNPDYEQFLVDFHRILGNFPQTTTAQPMKDPSRVRSLLKLSQEKGGMLDRFSVLSLKTLNQVHQEYTPEELIFVELVTQNKDVYRMEKHLAGRARERARKKAEKNNQPYPDDTYSGTIACVSGFLFNMVEQTVKLISPCNANDRWPLGYRIYQEGHFADAQSLKTLLLEMISNHMHPTVRSGDLLNFRPDLNYKSLDDGFAVSSVFLEQQFLTQKLFPYMGDLGEIIARGNLNAEDIALTLLQEKNVPLHETFYLLNSLMNGGIFDDEPPSKFIQN